MGAGAGAASAGRRCRLGIGRSFSIVLGMGIAVGIPTTALKEEGGCGNEFTDRLATVRAGAQRRILNGLTDFKGFVTLITLILVNGHS